MAESSKKFQSGLASLEELQNVLKCSICRGPFDDPRGLPCLHPFCHECLENWAKACSKDGKIVTCPLCKKVHQVPDEGMKGFPSHFLVNNLQNTVDKVKQTKSIFDLCEQHGEKKIYYCESCERAACSDCVLDPTHRGHSFIRLKQESQEKRSLLESLVSKVKEVEEKYVAASQLSRQMKQDIDRASTEKMRIIDEALNKHVHQVYTLRQAYKQEVYRNRDARSMLVDSLDKKLQHDLSTIRSSCKLATNMIKSGSDLDIISCYPSLLSTLQQHAKSQPSTVESTLRQIDIEPPECTAVNLPSLEQILHVCNKLHITKSSQSSAKPIKIWKECGEFSTAQHAPYPRGIAVHPNGDIAVTSNNAPVTVFSRNGSFKHVFRGNPSAMKGSNDIAITSSNCHVVPGSFGKKEFHIYRSNGYLVKTIPLYDINNKQSRTSSVAVDSRDRIIAGLGRNDHGEKTVSVHQPDGKVLSKFEATSYPSKLTTTPDDRLIISFTFGGDNTLKVMDQSGDNVSVIEPPPGLDSWMPYYTCCSKRGELFVGNAINPKTVYRYVYTGGQYKYLDAIYKLKEDHFRDPYGIALSADEEELFVVCHAMSVVKIFKRTDFMK